MPVAGLDYPGSYAELLSWFPDDAACLDYLEWLRWPDGIRCPRCAGRDGWRLGSGRWECAVCGRQASATAGTIFHRTRTPLRLWFAAAWQMTSQKHGVSALGVQRSLGLGSYQTAWAMLHRYRVAMVRTGRERLSGHVEVDETYLGGVESKVYGRETETKAIVAIAVEIENPKGFGRIRLGHIPDVSADSLLPFIDAAVEPGATVHTDGWQAYWTLPDRGYEHERTVMRKQSDPAHVVMPGVHRVASLLQRWLLGTHQGSVSVEHLQAYLNEYTFRFNRRHSRRRGLLFYRLLEQAVIAEPITYRGLIVNSKPTGRRPSLPSRPGRVATVQAVHRPWR
ncbi:MAG: IS1595 family transposase, partial [Solirubrobacteraceae bacterium]